MLPNIGVVGRKRTGKDTIADHLAKRHGYVRVALADPVKELALVLNPIVTPTSSRSGGVRLASLVAEQGWERAKDGWPEVRRVLQVFGTDIVRTHFGDRTWIDLALTKVRELNAQGAPVVIPDVRFPNEGEHLQVLVSARLLRVTRPCLSTEDNHDSERYTDTMPVDVEVPNTGTVSDLLKRVDDVLGTYERINA
jgi:hypothetical protein